MMWDYGDGGMGWGGWFLMSVAFVVFWGSLIGFVVWAVRSSHTKGSGSAGETSSSSRADELLDERFASGEIDAKEYTERRELLHAGRHR